MREQLDRNGDGRFDSVCEPATNPGDGICQYRETCAAQPEDCGVCPSSCNNAACEPELGETCTNCRADCAFCEPTFPVGLGFDATATPDDDRDGDGIFDLDDNAPDHFNPCQEDGDEDGVGDVADNCPDIVNPGQESNDEDSLGDACDNCLFVANEDQRDVDVEIPDPAGGFPVRRSDGVGDACDNCPAVVNVDQTLDCNADAVAALNDARRALGMALLPVRGDACDPIPCGETEIVDWIQRTPAGSRIHSVRASSRGVTLYVEQGRPRVVPIGYRSSELSTAPGGAARCF